MISFENQAREHIANIPTQLTALYEQSFRDEYIVVIDHLLPSVLANAMRRQALDLVEAHGARRDLIMDTTGGTPRHYTSVGRDIIRKQNGPITRFFESDAIRAYLSKIAAEELHKVPYIPEEYIVNSQQKSGDTHGWHWDDYTFALIWMVEAPAYDKGGRVEYIPRTKWDKEDSAKALEKFLKNQIVRSPYIPSGSCYLMRANTSLHRISPLDGDTQRTVIVFTYASTSDLTDPTITHETMEQIYADEVAVD